MENGTQELESNRMEQQKALEKTDSVRLAAGTVEENKATGNENVERRFILVEESQGLTAGPSQGGFSRNISLDDLEYTVDNLKALPVAENQQMPSENGLMNASANTGNGKIKSERTGEANSGSVHFETEGMGSPKQASKTNTKLEVPVSRAKTSTSIPRTTGQTDSEATIGGGAETRALTVGEVQALDAVTSASHLAELRTVVDLSKGEEDEHELRRKKRADKESGKRIREDPSDEPAAKLVKSADPAGELKLGCDIAEVLDHAKQALEQAKKLYKRDVQKVVHWARGQAEKGMEEVVSVLRADLEASQEELERKVRIARASEEAAECALAVAEGAKSDAEAAKVALGTVEQKVGDLLLREETLKKTVAEVEARLRTTEVEKEKLQQERDTIVADQGRLTNRLLRTFLFKLVQTNTFGEYINKVGLVFTEPAVAEALKKVMADHPKLDLKKEDYGYVEMTDEETAREFMSEVYSAPEFPLLDAVAGLTGVMTEEDLLACEVDVDADFLRFRAEGKRSTLEPPELPRRVRLTESGLVPAGPSSVGENVEQSKTTAVDGELPATKVQAKGGKVR